MRPESVVIQLTSLVVVLYFNTENCWKTECVAFRYSHPVCHQAVQPSFISILQNEVPEGSDVFRPSDVTISVYPSLTCGPQRSNSHWNTHCLRQFLFLCQHDVLVHTIIRLKQFTRCCIEILQFEVTGPFQRHTKALSMPAPPPKNVLRKTSRSRTDVAKVQKLAFTVFCQGFLKNTDLNHLAFMAEAAEPTDALTPCESFGLVNMLSKQWSMLAIFIAALNTQRIYQLIFKGNVEGKLWLSYY